MKKKAVWTIELPSNATRTGALYSAIQQLGGEVTGIKKKVIPFTDEECFFWRERWINLPNMDFHVYDSLKTVYAVYSHGNKPKVGVAKCHNEDTFNPSFGCALADARCLGDRKLERALLNFTPEQIKKYF